MNAATCQHILGKNMKITLHREITKHNNIIYLSRLLQENTLRKEITVNVSIAS